MLVELAVAELPMPLIIISFAGARKAGLAFHMNFVFLVTCFFTPPTPGAASPKACHILLLERLMVGSFIAGVAAEPAPSRMGSVLCKSLIGHRGHLFGG